MGSRFPADSYILQSNQTGMTKMVNGFQRTLCAMLWTRRRSYYCRAAATAEATDAPPLSAFGAPKSPPPPLTALSSSSSSSLRASLSRTFVRYYKTTGCPFQRMDSIGKVFKILMLTLQGQSSVKRPSHFSTPLTAAPATPRIGQPIRGVAEGP